MPTQLRPRRHIRLIVVEVMGLQKVRQSDRWDPWWRGCQRGNMNARIWDPSHGSNGPFMRFLLWLDMANCSGSAAMAKSRACTTNLWSLRRVTLHYLQVSSLRAINSMRDVELVYQAYKTSRPQYASRNLTGRYLAPELNRNPHWQGSRPDFQIRFNVNHLIYHDYVLTDGILSGPDLWSLDLTENAN